MATKFPNYRTDRFWSLVERRGEDDCWPWLGTKSASGGRFGTGGYGKYSKTGAHRVAYVITNGPIPDGLTIDHLCGRTDCVNPRHLEAVTSGDNTRRWSATRTHCKRGHEFTPENTHRARGKRVCRACNALHARSYRARRAGGWS